ncbi:START domain-containing protein [Glaciecola sp. 1036]|uniref:START domain-containing protein n=1 Tax=Alteromonadaceae TaxID=72275 RepID=UPI003D002DF5
MNTTDKFYTLAKALLWLLGISLSLNLMAKVKTEDWQQVKSENNIVISVAAASSGYSWIKAKTRLSGEPTDLVSLLNNTAVAEQWIDNCKKVEILETSSPNEVVVRTVFNAPWPVKDREMLTRSILTIDPETGRITIKIEDASSYLPSPSKLVRMQHISGEWQLQPVEDGHYEVIYIGYGEPAGNMPAWIANEMLVSSMMTTFKNMQKQLQPI